MTLSQLISECCGAVTAVETVRAVETNISSAFSGNVKFSVNQLWIIYKSFTSLVFLATSSSQCCSLVLFAFLVSSDIAWRISAHGCIVCINASHKGLLCDKTRKHTGAIAISRTYWMTSFFRKFDIYINRYCFGRSMQWFEDLKQHFLSSVCSQ